jgi:hypothetical protein
MRPEIVSTLYYAEARDPDVMDHGGQDANGCVRVPARQLPASRYVGAHPPENLMPQCLVCHGPATLLPSVIRGTVGGEGIENGKDDDAGTGPMLRFAVKTLEHGRGYREAV